MQLETKILSLKNARDLEKIHKDVYNSMEGSVTKTAIIASLQAIGLGGVRALLGGPAGTAATVGTLLWNFGQHSNTQTTKNYIHGASYAFKAIASLLSSGAYQRAEVEMLWTKYPSVSTKLKLAMGNMPPNVSKGYHVVRVQTKSGNWISFG